MEKQNVGGQAVIEGVMMQSKKYRAIAAVSYTHLTLPTKA